MKDKYLSIITNFGCHGLCPYCVVKENGIQVPVTTMEGLNNLIKQYNDNKCNIISISGGGDPLHNYNNHKDYYKILLQICQEQSIRMEIHTSYLNTNFPIEKCERVVYHLRTLEDLTQIKRRGNEIIRVVYVVTKDFNINKIDYIADFVNNSREIDELSFRQMIDNNYKETDYCQEYLLKGHKKRWYYIKQDDYNIYYVNGVVYNHFKDIKE